MFCASPKTALRFADDESERLDDGLHYWFAIQRKRMDELLTNHEAQPNEVQLACASEHLEEITGLIWPVDKVSEVLSLYPAQRINLALSGVDNADLSFAAANFFLGTTWPSYGDEVDIDRFVEVLQQQAQLMDFALAPPEI